MAKDNVIELTGKVEEVLPGNMFRVKVDTMEHIMLCYMGGKLKQHKIRIILGDKVKIESGYFPNLTVDFDPGAGTSNLTSAGNADIFLAKYDASGNYVWAKSMGGTGGDLGNSLALDGSGNVVVTGVFKATADFDPSAGTTNLTSMSGGQYGFTLTCHTLSRISLRGFVSKYLC